ncbi:MAG: glycosyltransferase [Alphaproteobacteria bacterium]|nr:glycosyltransferase [Alphaproteobacteria bacterium]
MDRPLSLSIVVPVYKGEKTVGALVEALSALAVPGGHEIVLVNDGSPDGSLAACREAADRAPVPVTVVNHARNYGEHNAVMTGLRHTRGQYVITMDDDLQNPPSEVVRLWRHARDNGRQVVYTRYAEKEHAWWRNLGSTFTNRCADMLLSKPRGLYLSSFRCMSGFVVDAILRYQGPFPYVDGLIMQVTQDIDSIVVQHLPRAEGRSNYTLRRLIALWSNMFLGFSVAPLRFSILIGLVMAGLGVLGALVAIVEAIAGEPPAGWASLMVVVLVLAGVQLIMIGAVGEYVGRVFLSINNKPQGTVFDVYRGPAFARHEASRLDHDTPQAHHG